MVEPVENKSVRIKSIVIGELVSESMLRLRSANIGKLDIENNFAKIVFAYLLFNIVLHF